MTGPQRDGLDIAAASNLADFDGGTEVAHPEAMLALSNSQELVRLLQRAVHRADRTRCVAIATAFIDGTGLSWLRTLDRASKVPIHVVTRPEAAAFLRPLAWRKVRVVSVAGLHAKAYAIVGRRDADSEAFVGSPNLTGPGLADNIEVGIRITGSVPDHAALVKRVAGWICNVSRRPHLAVG